ncbi:MAG TPA: hypothetical protein VLV86_08920 [Vicinamibacterales bacterium]|nr:hypothetical protein [Vicinamibacterales bacterium]
MTMVTHVALVPRGVKVDISDVTRVAAALSIQIARDLAPIWGVNATVSAFAQSKDVPVGYWPIYIEDPSKLPKGAGGVHLDRHNQPYALIETGDEWSLDASHECLEMLVDPSGNKVRANPILDQAIALGYPERQVQYVVEACDPIEDAQYGYQINGVLVSDFFTPHFYDPVKSAGVQYDFTGALSSPRSVLTNGYISWLDPVENAVMQLQNFINPQTGKLEPQIVNLSQQASFHQAAREEALRPAIDRATPHPDYRSGLTAPARSRLEARRRAVTEAAAARAKAMQ